MASVKTIEKRLLEGRCIDCGMGNMPECKESGFPEHRCAKHKDAYEAECLAEARKMAGESVHARNKRLKAEGIANLDRLVGVAP